MPLPQIRRTMFNVVADELAGVRDFYINLLGFRLVYESDWFIVLMPAEGPRFELGIIARGSEVTPATAARPAGGGYLTFVVDEVLTAFAQAQAMGAEIIEPPSDLFYGQRRMLVRDPAGTVIDISSPSPAQTA